MKKLIAIFLFISFFWEGIAMSSPIAKSWLYATILIENEWGEKGSGFLVAREMDQGKVKVFLCTNKHVLNKTKDLREKATKVILHLNVKEVEGKIIGKPYELPLIWPDGKKRWKEHPEADIDVLVLDVTDLVVSLPDMEKKWADYSLFADSKILSEQDITIGEEVMVVGYPLGFKQGDSNFPIVRQGIVASQIGQKFIEESIERDGKKNTRVIRGFLIDGGLIPGSSGSPVVLKPVTGRFVGNNIVMGVPPPYLLGIVAETRYAPIRTDVGDIPSYAGIGLAFDALTVKETIELFFK
jgi:S1-C subfamily serine protease